MKKKKQRGEQQQFPDTDSRVGAGQGRGRGRAARGGQRSVLSHQIEAANKLFQSMRCPLGPARSLGAALQSLQRSIDRRNFDSFWAQIGEAAGVAISVLGLPVSLHSS